MQTTNRETSGVPSQKVLIVYENVPAREQAAFHFGNLSGNLNTTVNWCASSRLNEPGYADEMSRLAALADMVVFAGGRKGDFSPEVKLWLERWLFKRSAREGVIVGLFSSASGGEIACLKEIYLRHTAHEAGLDYLSHLPAGSRRTIPDSLEMYNRRAGQVTSVLHEILENRVPPAPPL